MVITQLKEIPAEEIKRCTTLPTEAQMAQTDLRRALSISLGFPPTPKELAADPDLPRLLQKWRAP